MSFANLDQASRYDKRPRVTIDAGREQVWESWPSIISQLKRSLRTSQAVAAVECYQGVDVEELCARLAAGFDDPTIIRTAQLLKRAESIRDLVEPDVTDHPVFGYLTRLHLRDLFDESACSMARAHATAAPGLVFVVGEGATLVAKRYDLLVYADMPRWEIQQRQRRGEISNLGLGDPSMNAKEQYKRSYFVDWRVLDRHKRTLLERIDYLLDTTLPRSPKMLRGDAFRGALDTAARQPFRLVPFFDPGVWGGQWMKRVCGLDDDQPNYAWCFDCVPEENSLVLSGGGIELEIPAQDLVLYRPRQLLGDPVHARFGAEFPIRFDFLDTMGGQNLSFQVHPLTEYVQEHFGMHYTQDESYYILDAEPHARVYLGLREGVDRDRFINELEQAQTGGGIDIDAHAASWPVRPHDHVLIPAGTVHCSGSDCMVLEISATPYIFTFKLWDWGRVDLDGTPRPISLDHGLANIQWERTAHWVEANLINHMEQVSEGEGWREERTGLHEREFIETRRHWFTKPVRHDTGGTARGSVNVLNLVKGREATIESPSGDFEPFVVHYAETFVVPASVGPYTVRPSGESEGSECATVKASVRH